MILCERYKYTAALLALILFIMVFLPWLPDSTVSFADYAQIMEAASETSWDAGVYGDEASKLSLSPTGLMYETKWMNLQDREGGRFPLGAKQYLVARDGNPDADMYRQFDKAFLYCVAGHANGTLIHLGSQAFFEGLWDADHMPAEFPTGAGAADPIRRRFNFLVNVYASYFGANDSIAACNDANIGTAKYILASVINWMAADESEFTGNWEHDLEALREDGAYRVALIQTNPNVLGDRTVYRQLTDTNIEPAYKARGCQNWSEWMFATVWDAAVIANACHVDQGQTVYYADKEDGTGTFTVTVPYPNDETKEHYQNLKAKELFGDWIFHGPSDHGLVFSSASGDVPEDGRGIAILGWDGREGASLAKDIGKAQLATFKFFNRDPRSDEARYSFSLTQTYFVAKMDSDLEIHVRIGAAKAAGASSVARYCHTEGFGASYPVNLIKYDAETGQPLAGSHWDILEAFDDTQLESVNLDLAGPGEYISGLGFLNGISWEEDRGTDEERIAANYAGSSGLNDSEAVLYNRANDQGSQFELWEDPERDPCNRDDHVTGEDGILHYTNTNGDIAPQKAHCDTKIYTYKKGLCTGHPAPEVNYEEVPDPEYDESSGEQTNSDEIEAIEEYNQQLHDSAWQNWLTDVAACEALIAQGGFFHALDVTGETQRNALESDRDQFYRDFISLTYRYSAKETQAAPGYTLHGRHRDDIPVEWRTCTSSEYKEYCQNGEELEHTMTSGGEHEEKKDLELFGETNTPVWENVNRKPDSEKQETMYTEDQVRDSATPSDADADVGTDSNAHWQEKGITLTGFVEGLREGKPHMTGSTAHRLRLGTTKEADDGEGMSVRIPFTSLPEDERSDRIIPFPEENLDWTFLVYNHRTEGEIHISKRDMQLEEGETPDYDSYGDSQGDGTLEGGVYGLFAAEDIDHPDGHTGKVYEKNNLVAIATTDRNGDASFMAFTEAPGYTYDDREGRTEKTADGWSENAPVNLYSSAREGETSRPDIRNNEVLNGNCWIGRPLFVNSNGTQYYVKELSRSEGYELSVFGRDAAITNRNAFEAGGEVSAEGTVGVGAIEVNRLKHCNTFAITSRDVSGGYTIYCKGIPQGASFYTTREEVTEDPSGTHTEYVSEEEILTAEDDGGIVVIGQGPVEARVGDVISLPNGQSVLVEHVISSARNYTAASPENAFRYTIPSFQDLTGDLKEDGNVALKRASFKEPDEGAPWALIPVTGSSFEEQADSLQKGMDEAGLSNFNCLRIDSIRDHMAVIRYSYRIGSIIADSIYDEVNAILYIRKPIIHIIDGDKMKGYLYARYANDDFMDYKANSTGFITYAKVRQQVPEKEEIVYPEDPDAITWLDVPEKTYWAYKKGDPLRDSQGTIRSTVVYREIQAAPGYERRDVDIPVMAVYDKQGYTIHVAESAGSAVTTYKITYDSDFMETESCAPEEYAAYRGSLSVSLTLNRAGTYVEPVTLRYDSALPYSDGNTRRTRNRVVERPIKQKIKIVKDIGVNEAGRYDNHTYANHQDNFTEVSEDESGNITYLDNFRFKIYLKSNLERLFRNEDGTVIWQDRNGTSVDVWEYKKPYPQLVQKFYTQVSHQTRPLTRDSNESVIAGAALYGYTDGLINENRNTGYTAVLERINQDVRSNNNELRTVREYNYAKFFDAIRVANQERWDRKEGERTSTSYKPFAAISEKVFGTAGDETNYPAGHNNPEIRNESNTSDMAENNSISSDYVRQFAITWYLEDEVKKLVGDNPAGETQSIRMEESYQEEIYDTALNHATAKAEDYLLPFFTYDLDEIYAISWDSQGDGGSDHDASTLSADLEDEQASVCYGISQYLPYGTYVAVEQQPSDSGLNDFYNKHYRIDAPREIVLPSVYEDRKNGSDETPEQLNPYYNYNVREQAQELCRRFYIRFNEEWPGDGGDDLRNYVIRAHNDNGDYEIYKYGLDLDNLGGTKGGDVSGEPHFTVTQDSLDPIKDYYNTIVDPVEKGGNPSSHYDADDKNNGKIAPNGTHYEDDAIERQYRYGSISEDKGWFDHVPVLISPEDSGESRIHRNRVAGISGMQNAYDGSYAAMLVPWSVTEPVDERAEAGQNEDGSSSYQGYAYRRFRNTFYSARIRIEKLDSETGESILHDGAVFALYAAKRENGRNTNGRVKFYEKETMIMGSKEYLEAMGASRMAPAARWMPGAGNLWTGYVPAGTPVCSEREQIILKDGTGRMTGQFEAHTTVRDGLQTGEHRLAETSFQNQTVGYLELPQPLGAGVYVLCEIKPPAGYARVKPMAVEIYSDQITYYLEGDNGHRVRAAIYQAKSNQQDGGLHKDLARIYVENTPIRLEVSKIKSGKKVAVNRTDTRLEGTLIELTRRYGKENLEFAYKNGTYLGYAWKKGTLEYLESRKASGEEVTPVYENGMFAGYGLVARPLDTADDESRYVAGAKLTLFEGIEIKKNGDREDYAYDGVEVTRDANGNVQSVKVKKGFAGNAVRFIRKEDVEGSLEGKPGDGTWTYQAVERDDTDILFYPMADLDVTEIGADGNVYGYDRNGRRILVRNRESIYALKHGRPVFEISGNGLEGIQYFSSSRGFTSIGEDTVIYHLDSDGRRDAMVDPVTGMAYVTGTGLESGERGAETLMVWPVKISRTKNGAIIAQEKIPTYRIATINSDTAFEYTIGTYNGSDLKKTMNPVLDCCGLPVYYQKSAQEYTKGEGIFDLDGDYIRYRYSGLLEGFNQDAYRINDREELHNIGDEHDVTDDAPLYHRQGEAYIMENTWISGEDFPNDPFRISVTTHKTDMLKRVSPGNYILEELEVPDGYVRSFPEGFRVKESEIPQNIGLEDEKIKVEFVKTDAPAQYRMDVFSDYQDKQSIQEAKGAYSYDPIKRAHMALYRARRVYTSDITRYPKGYYLEKAEDHPAQWTMESDQNTSPAIVTADWICDGKATYFEGIPSGDYLLEEKEAPPGYLAASMEVTVLPTGEVQTFELRDDHTKLEVYKYVRDENGAFTPLPNDHAATLCLYEAISDPQGDIVFSDGQPMYDKTKVIEEWTTDDLRDYRQAAPMDTGIFARLGTYLGLRGNRSSFVTDFEAAFQKQGTALTSIQWNTERGRRSANLTSIERVGGEEGAALGDPTDLGGGVTENWTTDTGKVVRITIYRNITDGSLDTDGKLPLVFEYQFNYRELSGGIKSYDTLEGMHRIDYLPFHTIKNKEKVGNYVLIEKQTPDGYQMAEAKAITIGETGAIQRFGLENKEKYIDIIKTVQETGEEGELKSCVVGVTLGLYRADENGDYSQDDSQLIETWLTGADGRYTKEDQNAGLIPPGFKPGDLKPHRVTRIPYGLYYIVELDAPDFMAINPPVKVEIGPDDTGIFHVVNHLSKGRVEIRKRGADTGGFLAGARFRVNNIDTGDFWFIITDETGKAVLDDLSVGKINADGRITPWNYTVEEVTPPDLYQVAFGQKSFQFNGAGNEKVITWTAEYEDKPTEIRFHKVDFDTGFFVNGAKLAIYRAKAVDGRYQKDGPPIETMMSSKDGFTVTKKLAAGHTYLLEELEAPPGMTFASAVVFTINARGTGIETVSSEFATLSLIQEDGVIGALTVKGRVPIRLHTTITDTDTHKLVADLEGTDPKQVLTAKDGILDGHAYELAEYVTYSDGRDVKTACETRRIYLDERGEYCFPSRTFLNTQERLSDDAGNILATWNVSGAGMEYTLFNPVKKEEPFVKVVSQAGEGNQAVRNNDIVKYQIDYKNPYSRKEDIRVVAVLESGLWCLRAEGQGVITGNTIVWQLKDIGAHESGSLELVAVVEAGRGKTAEAGFTVHTGNITRTSILKNPVALDGSFTIVNGLTGTGKNENDSFTCHVRFQDGDGKLLRGFQAYDGSVSGRVKGEGDITMKGDQFVIFSGLPYGTSYIVTQQETMGYELESTQQEGSVQKDLAASAVFINHRDDETVREILTAKGAYLLTETTFYSDGTSHMSGKYRFRLNENGMVDNVDMEEQPVKLYFSKTDLDTSEEVAGGRYSLIDPETGEVIYEFEKEREAPVRIPEKLLKSGKGYLFHEVDPPAGYACEEDLRIFTDWGGAIQQAVMEDKKTEVWFSKTDIATGEELAGGRYAVIDVESGKTVLAYTASGQKVKLKGALLAGHTYEFREELAPAGYAYSESVLFTVPQKPGPLRIEMKDKPTDVQIGKLPVPGQESSASTSDASGMMAGVVLQILHEDRTSAKAIQDFGGFHKGEDLIFTTKEGFTGIVKQLIAGENYLLHEITPRDGYALAEDRLFTVSRDGRKDQVVLFDKPTQVVFSKRSMTGEEELSGCHMAVEAEDGGEIETWISGTKPHELIGKLIAGNTYYLCERKPEEGYAFAKKVPFTVSWDGTTDTVFMRNHPTEVKIKKINESGAELKGAVLQIMDEKHRVIIPDFLSDETPMVISGRLLAGETYILHEVRAPSGCLLAADIPFTMPKEAKILEITMSDPLKPDTSTPDREKVQRQLSIRKTDAMDGRGMPGVEFTISAPDGSLYRRVVTGENGRARFDLPPDGTYTYKETKTIPGYLLSEETFSFTILHGTVTEDSILAVADWRDERKPRVGRITATYDSDIKGASISRYPGGKAHGRQTGDRKPLFAVALVLILCGAGLLISFLYEARKWKK